MTEAERKARAAERSRERYRSMTREQKAAYSAQVSEASRRRRERDPEATRERDRANYVRNRERILARVRAQYYSRTADQVAADRLSERERYLRIRDTDEFRERKARSDSRRPSRAGVKWDRAPSAKRAHVERLREQQRTTSEYATETYQPWTPAADAEALRTDLTVVEIALRLGRTRSSVVTRRRDLRRKARDAKPNHEGNNPS